MPTSSVVRMLRSVRNNCRSINYDESLLQRTPNYVDRFSTEKAYCEYEKVGRLITLYGAMNEAAALMEDPDCKVSAFL